jgi:hypothetical protein
MIRHRTHAKVYIAKTLEPVTRAAWEQLIALSLTQLFGSNDVASAERKGASYDR